MLPKKTASYVTGVKIADFLCKFADIFIKRTLKTDNMKRTFLLAAMVAAVVCAGTDASAQRKAKKSQLVLDGTVVNVNPLARTSPVEEKLKAKNTPGIEYAPTKTVYLYPKGQGVDQGIVENGVAVT